MLIIRDYIRLVISRKPKDHIQRQARWNNAKDHYTKYKDIIKDYELERMINSKTAELQLVFSEVTSLRGRLGKLIQKLLLNQKHMGYLVRVYYIISPTMYYKDESCWSVELNSKASEDIISIGSFLEVLVLNHYVLVRKILNVDLSGVTSCDEYEGDFRKFSDIGAWYALDDCVQYDKKCSNPTSAISDETIANPNAQIVGDDTVRI
nr:hypothetical protein [Tanacetum cinerariifolium]